MTENYREVKRGDLIEVPERLQHLFEDGSAQEQAISQMQKNLTQQMADVIKEKMRVWDEAEKELKLNPEHLYVYDSSSKKVRVKRLREDLG